MKHLTLACLALLATFSAAEDPKVWVHAPAEDLLALFPEKGAGFLITIEEYHRLRTRAQANADAEREKPPLAARLVSGVVDGTVKDDTLHLEANYLAVVYRKGATALSFPLEGAALDSVEVAGVNFAAGEWAGGALRFEQPGTYAVRAKFSVRLRKNGEARSAAFRLPPAAGHKVSLKLPPSVRGEVGPIVRAFKTGESGGTVVGFPDEHGVFKVWFAPRAPAQRLDPVVSGYHVSKARIGEARTIVSSSVRLIVQRATIDRVTLGIDKGQTIRGVTGKRIKSWRVAAGTDSDRLEIRFVEPLQGAIDLTLDTELARDQVENVAIPLPKMPDAVRYEGEAWLTTDPQVRLVGLDTRGVRRHDDKNAVRFGVWSDDARIRATVERVAATTRSNTVVLLAFREEGKSLRARFRYTIAGQPLFRLEPALPAKWILRRLALNGRPHPHRYEDDGRLILEFPFGLKPGAHTLDLLL
ncbi:MAG: hypothetical protein OER88_10890, partial [Planctomycetota bacterium]|nr:hypothetical protein [Planctomycetota bacterium]